MKILISFEKGWNGDELINALKEQGFQPQFLAESKGPYPLGLCVATSPGIMELGERVSSVRAKLEEKANLLVCSRALGPSGQRALIKCGATALLVPEQQRNRAIIQRILGQLFLLTPAEPFGCLMGKSKPMATVYHYLQTVAALSEPILLVGESGSGKELCAQELHHRGRPNQPLISLNCAALTTELLESELFGHERGSFSGAVTRREGLLLAAGNGTVFLDEIGDLALPAQAKLLRVIEEKKVRPVGSNLWQPIKARLVLATHRDLDQAVRDGRFRRDLFERFRGFTLKLPSLREHPEDLPQLANAFVEDYNREYRTALFIDSACLNPLFAYPWPGNVRELKQLIRLACAFADNKTGPISQLHIEDALIRRRDHRWSDANLIPFNPAQDTWKDVENRAWQKYARALLNLVEDNVEEAAKRADLSRSTFYGRMKQNKDDPG